MTQMTHWKCSGSQLTQEIRQTVPAPGSIAFWFLGQVGFAIKYQDKVILIDPMLDDLTDADGTSLRMYPAPFAPDNLHADYVLCTHGHADHMARETLTGLVKANPDIRIMIPAGCLSIAREYGIAEDNLLLLAPGDSIALGKDITVDAMSAAHPTHVFDKADPAMALSYHMTLGEKHVVHLGDTYLTESLYKDLTALPRPDVLMMPINGDDYFRRADNIIGNMEAEEAAKLAYHLRAELSVPMHYDMIRGNLANPLRFAEKMQHGDGAFASQSVPLSWHIPVLGARFII